MIPLKSDRDLEMLRFAGRLLAKVMQRLKKEVGVGVTTQEIDKLAEELVRKEHALPAFKGYKGFPSSVCASINEEIVHGIPSQRKLKEGDIFSLDLGIKYRGYFVDAAVTLPIGRISNEKARLIEAASCALEAGIKQAKANNYLSDISHTIQRIVEERGFSVVRQFVVHGIGFNLHEEPEIPNFGMPYQGPLLKKGMVFAIEPMVNMGGWESEIMDNGWTAVTKDRLASAHFEHTIAITQGEPEILTNG